MAFSEALEIFGISVFSCFSGSFAFPDFSVRAADSFFAFAADFGVSFDAGLFFGLPFDFDAASVFFLAVFFDFFFDSFFGSRSAAGFSSASLISSITGSAAASGVLSSGSSGVSYT